LESKSSEYKNIFKSTFLFGFVQIFNILTKVVLNKSIAVFAGTGGVGLLGIFQSVSEMLKTLFGLGVCQSAVRDISKANTDKDFSSVESTVKTTSVLNFILGVFSILMMITFSGYLSVLSFGDRSYTLMFSALSVVVFFGIISEGQLSILKGLRHLRSIAKSMMFGSLFGTMCGVPLYYFWGVNGVLPSLIITSFILALFSTYYVRGVGGDGARLKRREFLDISLKMIKVGIALMLVTFAATITNFVIKAYILNTSSLKVLGYYQAGTTIVAGYFSIIVAAMMTDYYPRISAIFDNDSEISKELNKQVKVGMIIITPLLIIFILFMPLIIRILYSGSFLVSIQYIQYAVLGMLIILCSNPVDMILVAKQKMKIFLFGLVLYRTIMILLSIYLFTHYGLRGLGIADLIMAIIHLIMMSYIVSKLYNIRLDNHSLFMLGFSLLLSTSCIFITFLDGILFYIMSILVLAIVLIYFMTNLNKILELKR
jgi:O-antigen/teichoic acid export membrane protein